MHHFSSLAGLAGWLIPSLGSVSVEWTLWAGLVALLLWGLRIDSPRVRHLAWLLVLIKPLTTVLVASWVPIGPLSAPLAGMAVLNGPIGLIGGGQAARAVPLPADGVAATPHPGLVGVLALTWLVGSALGVLRSLAGYGYLALVRRRAARVTAGPLQEALERAAADVGLRRRVHLALSEGSGPVAVLGLTRPLVLLPRALGQALSPEQLHLILCHELHHVRRLDNLVLAMQHLVEAALFFHPVVWLCRQQLRREAERACDEAVLRCLPSPVPYADSLARVAEATLRPGRRFLLAGCAAAQSQLAWRVRYILADRRPVRSTAYRLSIGLCLVVAALTGLPGFLRRPEARGQASGQTGEHQSGGQSAGATAEARPVVYYLSIVRSRPLGPPTWAYIEGGPTPDQQLEAWRDRREGDVQEVVTLGLVDSQPDSPEPDPSRRHAQITAQLSPYMEQIQAMVWQAQPPSPAPGGVSSDDGKAFERELGERLNAEVFSEAFTPGDLAGVLRVGVVHRASVWSRRGHLPATSTPRGWPHLLGTRQSELAPGYGSEGPPRQSHG